ncbi:hypothetical protein KY290_033841 [Solanum tuberosum]|uniref:Uncharacterized protein n=1 Tax=Solanum tuberosum TaxID=4113 RepID=A0ABQ7U2T7_SOLTU|nr:hypothetical protein KY289_033217 [Solanum tuberosum]KAH0649290.1 hypothetical protein KY285_034538 [Solanum tuberosum]KAH0740798.1 hypothetical protein KY290_033841 [Solanum tuberosum]
MDKSWIGKPQTSNEYLLGLDKFLDFAFKNSAVEDTIRCPCPICHFSKWKTKVEVQDHLICKPFPQNYVTWNIHGEKKVLEPSGDRVVTQETFHPENPIETMINDAFGQYRQQVVDVGTSQPLGSTGISNEGHREGFGDFHDFLKDGSETLYEGSKYTKLEFLIKLYHIKVYCRMTDKAMTMILDLLRDAFEDAKLPPSFYEAKKTIKKLGLDYTKIPACPNNCMLFWEGDSELEVCKHCGTSKWSSNKKKKQAAKVLRYFPLKPMLKRLFMCSKTAEHMRWHASESNPDGLMRHPRDGEAWKTFDQIHSGFSSDPRNVRLGLATDGFNPFGTMSSTYSIWPVFLIPYNLPPWMCMKHTSFILSMIIPGKQTPRNNIDVYLQPLVKELHELWNDGVETFDSSLNETFRMHAALMWRISNFPGLGILSGWNTYTGFACPTCNFDTEPCRLHHGKKWCFMGHRRFLRRNHRFRLSRVRFNGSTEERNPPLKLSGSNILRQIVEGGGGVELNGRRKRSRRATKQWNKRSIFFELPYWDSNLLRHNLDFMHIEKNICDNIIYTLLDDKSKSKDNANARTDLREMRIRPDLWLKDDGSYNLAVFSLLTDNKKKVDTKKLFLTTLKNIKVPDGYSSNISRCVDLAQKKNYGLKSHDSHVLLEQLLPLAIRNVLPYHVVTVLVKFSSFFRALSSKTLNPSELDILQECFMITLCHLEMLFPSSFFTVMVHLSVHLVVEAKLGGPVHYQNMYPVERELGYCKPYVRNKSQLEGCIAEGHIAEKTLTFCSWYIEDIETRFNRPRRVHDEPTDMPSGMSSLFPQLGKPASASENFPLNPMQKLQAHRYVLLNCAIVTPFVEEYIKRSSRGRRPSPTEIERRVNKEFVDWFQKRQRRATREKGHVCSRRWTDKSVVEDLLYGYEIRRPFPWRHYFQNTHRLIFVVDRNDNDHVVETRDKLHRVLNEVSTFCFISPGPVHKKDVMKASVMLEKKKEYATILAFDVKVTQEAQELSDELGVKFRVYIDTIKEEKKGRKLLKKQSFPDCTELCLQHEGKYIIKF